VTRPKRNLKFVLTEDDKVVRAVLSVDGLRVLEFENLEPPRVISRHPKASEKELLEMAKYWSRNDRALKPRPTAVLDRYIDSRDRDIAKHMIEIRKALRKLAAAARNATVAKKAKKSLARDA
jgi:hypothetical protein